MRDLFEEEKKGKLYLYCAGDGCRTETWHTSVNVYNDPEDSSKDSAYFECQECKSTVNRNRFQN